jgi:hypothetical protein
MPRVSLRNNFVEYDFEFRQKFLIIRGDSGKGKTTLIDLVRDSNSNPEAVDCLADKDLKVVESERDLATKGMILFMDECNPILFRDDCAELLNSSDNYFVIVSRFGIRGLTQTVEVEMVSNGRKHELRGFSGEMDCF